VPRAVSLRSVAVASSRSPRTDRTWRADQHSCGLLPAGITTAKLVKGEWGVFGLQLPELWTDGRTTGLGFTIRS